jgi:hypothetical protein
VTVRVQFKKQSFHSLGDQDYIRSSENAQDLMKMVSVIGKEGKVVCLFVFSVLGIELKSLHMLGK